MDNVENIQELIGREVISLETANKLGRVADLLVDTLAGQLAGFAVRRPDDTIALASVLSSSNMINRWCSSMRRR